MAENKTAKTPADGGAGCIDGVWYGTAPTANRAMTLEEMQQWIATTWKRCQDEAWRQLPTKTPSVVVYLTAGTYSLEKLEELVQSLKKVANDDVTP
jgi:hypothetical protein